jgi:ligand-binding sensor domain-containing protein
MFAFCTHCKGQTKSELSKDDIKSETQAIITSYGPNAMVRTIEQDRNGNIWLASTEGIIQYDGKSFTNITGKVSSARFFSVLEDRKGNFWFASMGSGVFYYDGKSFKNFTTTDGLASDRVYSIYEDKTGNIWFSTDGGASRYNGKSFRNYRMNGELLGNDVNSKDHNDVNSIIEDKTGKFWFGTRGNACTYDGKTFTIVTHNGRPFRNVRTIIEDKKGNIWLGGSDGMWRYDGSTFTNFTPNFVGYIYEDKNGNIWTSSASATNQGWALSRYDGKSLYNSLFINSPILKPTVTELTSKGGIFGILEDNDGSIWFGAGDGVHRYDGNTITDFKD